ncbi:MFS transporter [Pseudonocardia asaccharolytica]|uniref:MFS transporter n=1 Tax=Pseudonocardia asaccharolytica TaxID=54010 RepID=UPI0003FA5439|nr:MFS transporter [Pseudonocardia asaccharolytica]
MSVPAEIPDSAVRTAVRTELFGPARRATTIGLVLLISLIAFEAMGVGTAMPAIVADLGAVSHYAWPFVAFMASAVIGTVLGGRWCDVAGPRVPLVVAPTLFGAGLIVAGTADGMGQLLVGRFLQGLGAGAQGVAVYVLVAAVYPQRVRPAVFGLISSAWVLPALIGPPVSGIVTERLSWHWVFLGLVPVVLLAVALVAPAARRLGPPDPGRATPPARRGFALAAVGAAAGVSALSWASQQTSTLAAVVAAGAAVLLVPSMRRLLPVGVFRARRGVPTLVAARGLLAGTFFTVNSYLPLMLADTHRWSLTMAGVPLLVGSLGWSAAAAWQGRHPGLARHRLLRAGFCLLAAGTAGMLLVAPAWGVPWLAAPLWALAGLGMGLGFSSVAYLLLAQSAPGEVGFHSSAAQLSDQLTTALMIAVGGGLLALFGSAASALPVLVAGLTAMAVIGVLVAGRTAGEHPDVNPG